MNISQTRKSRRTSDALTQAQLRDLATKYNVPFEGLSNANLELAVAEAIWNEENPGEPFPEQISPMLIHDLTSKGREEVEKYKSKDWFLQKKLNGMRLICSISPNNTVKLTSRARSVKTLRFSELDDKVLGLQNIDNPFKNGSTILDGEIIHPKAVITLPSGVTTESTLQSTVALMHLNTKQSLEVQEREGSLQFNAFDILRLDGENTEKLPYEERTQLLYTVIETLKQANPDLAIICVPVITEYNSAWEVFEQYVAEGGEGLILKNRKAPYEQGIRTRNQYKLKAFVTVDGFITGFTPATKGKGNEGYIGGFEFSAFVDGVQRVIGAAANIPQATRIDATIIENGVPTLNPSYLNRCAELIGQDWNKKSLRLNSCRISEWREDKNPEDCQVFKADMRFNTSI